MKNISAKKGVLFFYLFDIVLLAVLLLGLMPFTKKNKIHSMDSALLNVNHINDIRKITIACSEDDDRHTVTLIRSGSFWIGTDSYSGKKYFWPADSQCVNNLIAVSSQVVKLYTKAEKVTAWKSFGVDDDNASVLSFYNEAGGTISSLYFGYNDGLTQRIALRTWIDKTVYETDNSIKTYLTADVSFWSDPFMYPQCVTGYGRTKSESLLRHGTLLNIAPADYIKPVDTKRIDYENGAKGIFAIYEKDDEYVIIPVFTAGIAASDEERNAIQSINYRYSISKWTYEKFVEN